MEFLKTISRLVASENLPVTWHTPLGFPVQMMCYKKESKRVKTKMGDSIVKLSILKQREMNINIFRLFIRVPCFLLIYQEVSI